MRNLISFFRRFRVFIFFIILQLISLSTYFSYLNYPRSTYLTTASSVAGNYYSFQNEITKHLNLSYNNQRLLKENNSLRRKMIETFVPLEKQIVKINDTIHEQQYSYLEAMIVNSSVTRKNNYFTLNAGWRMGLKRGLGVFSANGVVGIIHNVSEHFSVVKTVLSENINIDIMVEKTGVYGMLKWNAKNASIGSMANISNDLVVKKWSKIVTRGGSGIFPRGIPVGKIISIGSVEGQPIWDISIKFSEDYRKLQYVYIVKNLLIEEKKNIESTIPEEE